MILSPYFKGILLVLFIGVLISRTDFDPLFTLLRDVESPNLVIALILKFFGIAASTWVLYYSCLLLQERIEWLTLFKIYFLSYFFNNLGLGSLGGDSYKWLRLKTLTGSKLKTTIALYDEKVLGLSVLSSFVIVSSILHFYGSFNLIWYVFILPLSTGIIYIYLFIIDTILKINVVRKSIILPYLVKREILTWDNKYSIYSAVFFSFIFYTIAIYSFYFIYTSIDSYIPLRLAFYVIPIVIFINAVPISFQGLGVREVSIAFLFQYLGFSFEMGVAAALLLFAINLSVSALSGLYLLSQKELWH